MNLSLTYGNMEFQMCSENRRQLRRQAQRVMFPYESTWDDGTYRVLQCNASRAYAYDSLEATGGKCQETGMHLCIALPSVCARIV